MQHLSIHPRAILRVTVGIGLTELAHTQLLPNWIIIQNKEMLGSLQFIALQYTIYLSALEKQQTRSTVMP